MKWPNGSEKDREMRRSSAWKPDTAPRWLALYTRGRHEKFIQGELEKKRIESFLPTRLIKRRWSDRTVTLEEPLFKSYLFVRTDPSRFLDILKTKGAVQFVSAEGKPVPIGEKVIESLKTLIAGGAALDPFPYLKTGDRVYVKSGIFKRVEGFVARKDDKKCRLVISVDALMSSISLEVDTQLVEKI